VLLIAESDVDSIKCKEAIAKLCERYSELYGTINATQASIKIVAQYGAKCIIRCSLSALDSVLVTIALSNPPVLTMGSSGSLHKLKSEASAVNVS
jgi:RNase P/RNase MRP subunit POP5